MIKMRSVVIIALSTIMGYFGAAIERRAEAAGLCGYVRLDCSTLEIPPSLVPPVTEAMQNLADNTTGNVSTSMHGYVPKAPNDAVQCLLGTGAWGACPGGGGGSSFTTGYSVDFTGLPSQNLLTGGDGAKTIDGHTWTLANSANLTTAYLNDGTHSGLYLRCNTNNSNNDATNLTGGALYTALGNLSSAFSTNLLGQYSEVWVWYLFSTPHTPNANTEEANLGVFWLSGTYNPTSFARMRLQNLYYNGIYYGQTESLYNGVSTWGYGQGSNARDVFVFKVMNATVEAYSGVSSAGAFPAKSTLTYAGRVPFTLPMSSTAGLPIVSSAVYAWMSVVSQNTAGNSDMLVAKMLVEYR